VENKPIEFDKKKDFVIKKQLGQGGFGQTVLLYDSTINEYFVCKKYAPFDKAHKEEFYKNFVEEIKFLYLVNHPNIVRIFNYYLYPDHHTGYIVMEYVKGQDIEDHLEKFPENVNKLFVQTIEGFAHLESSNILHRDIRPQNIMIGENAAVKIIDFGFGKRAHKTADFDKSISLNWQFDPPNEFKKQIYNFQTEIYFVGKLFEKIIQDKQIAHFQYKALLNSMCQAESTNRSISFADIRSKIFENKFSGIAFSEDEKVIYRQFSDALYDAVNKIQSGAKYLDDADKVQLQLESVLQRVMLEEYLPDKTALISCFIKGGYYFSKRASIEVAVLEQFVQLLKGNSKEKKNIIIANLHSRLDSLERYEESALDDEIPF
jgi:eukaryotic-like serine/threonine-protein kinase